MLFEALTTVTHSAQVTRLKRNDGNCLRSRTSHLSTTLPDPIVIRKELKKGDMSTVSHVNQGSAAWLKGDFPRAIKIFEDAIRDREELFGFHGPGKLPVRLLYFLHDDPRRLL